MTLWVNSAASHQHEPATHVRFALKADKSADICPSPLRAKRGLTHCNKRGSLLDHIRPTRFGTKYVEALRPWSLRRGVARIRCPSFEPTLMRVGVSLNTGCPHVTATCRSLRDCNSRGVKSQLRAGTLAKRGQNTQPCRRYQD